MDRDGSSKNEKDAWNLRRRASKPAPVDIGGIGWSALHGAGSNRGADPSAFEFDTSWRRNKHPDDTGASPQRRYRSIDEIDRRGASQASAAAADGIGGVANRSAPEGGASSISSVGGPADTSNFRAVTTCTSTGNDVMSSNAYGSTQHQQSPMPLASSASPGIATRIVTPTDGCVALGLNDCSAAAASPTSGDAFPAMPVQVLGGKGLLLPTCNVDHVVEVSKDGDNQSSLSVYDEYDVRTAPKVATRRSIAEREALLYRQALSAHVQPTTTTSGCTAWSLHVSSLSRCCNHSSGRINNNKTIRNDAKKIRFDEEKADALARIPDDIKSCFRRVAFARFGKRGVLPVIELSPYDVPPGSSGNSIRAQWFQLLEESIRTGKPMKHHLIYWYGHESLDRPPFSFYPPSKIIPYGVGVAKGYGKIPAALQRKVSGNKKLSKSDLQLIRGLEQIARDAPLEPSARIWPAPSFREEATVADADVPAYNVESNATCIDSLRENFYTSMMTAPELEGLQQPSSDAYVDENEWSGQPGRESATKRAKIMHQAVM